MPKRKHPQDMCRLNGVAVVARGSRETARKFRLRDGAETWLPDKLVVRLGGPYGDSLYDIAAPRWLLEDRGVFKYD